MPREFVSLSRLVDIGAVLHFEKNECWMQPPLRLQSHGGEPERIPLNRIGGLYEIELHKMALGAEDVRKDVDSDAATFTAKAKAAFKSRPEWDPTDFTDPKFHSAVYKGKSFLSGDLDLWHRRMRHVSKEQLKQVSAHGIIDGFNLVGNKNDTQCRCKTCAMAKIRRHACRRTKYVDAPKRIGEHVSSDVKVCHIKALQVTSMW